MSDQSFDDDFCDKVVVVDNGSACIKAGFAGDDSPRVFFPNTIGTPKQLNSFQNDTYIGSNASEKRDILNLQYPVNHGIVTDWDAMEAVWDYMFKTELQIRPEEHVVLLSEHGLNPLSHKEKMAEIMFEAFGVEGFYIAIPNILSIYAYGRGSAISIDSGAGVTSVLPIYESYLIQNACHRINMGGEHITEYLAELLAKRGYSFSSNGEMGAVREMKEKHCVISEKVLLNNKSICNVESVEHVLPGGRYLTLDSERALCTEALFYPHVMGSGQPGIQDMVYESIMKCPIDTRADICANICVSGGNTMFPGFKNRLLKEMKALLPSNIKITIVAGPERKMSSWIGGSILGSLSAFQYMQISRVQFEEHGTNMTHRKCLSLT